MTLDKGSMEPIKSFTSRMVVLPNENIDTDQIIPARFLKITDKQSLGQHLFTDWRYAADGQPHPEFVLNRPEAQGAHPIAVDLHAVERAKQCVTFRVSLVQLYRRVERG